MIQPKGAMIVFINNPEIGYFILNHKGKIINSRFCFEEIWEGSYIDLSTISTGEKPMISFNKRENEKIGKSPVFDHLQSVVDNYITSVNFKN